MAPDGVSDEAIILGEWPPPGTLTGEGLKNKSSAK